MSTTRPSSIVKVSRVQQVSISKLGLTEAALLTGRKRFLTVDTLGLLLRVLVTAANVGEREGGCTGAQAGETDEARGTPLNDDLGRWRLRWSALLDVGDGCVPLDCSALCCDLSRFKALRCSRKGGSWNELSVG